MNISKSGQTDEKLKIQSSNEIPSQNIKKSKYDLRDRLLIFIKNILFICRRLPKIPECESIRRQLVRSASSIGANYEEADGALSRKDFVNKVGISRKEAKETRYWLSVIHGDFCDTTETMRLIQESEEIIKILSAIIRNTKKHIEIYGH